jgi:FtsP/CotA-like multicopper oxidase with cupredoxin domain
MIARRRILAGGAAAAGLAALRSMRARAGDENPWARLMGDYATVRPPSFTRPVPIPPIKRPTRTGPHGDEIELVVSPGEARPLAGNPTQILGFDGTWPGPTILATRGQPTLVSLTNRLREPANVHNHGHRAPPSSDGHPLQTIKPGETRVYTYPNQQSGGTYWYHDHTYGLTGSHVYRGLAGFYIIHDPAEDALGLPSGAHDIPLVIQDRLFDAGNQLSYTIDAGTTFKGVLGNTLCTNGVHTPVLAVATRRYRFRFLNGCNSRNLRLGLSNGEPMLQIASDGSLLAGPVRQTSVDLAPSERADCVIDFGAAKPGTSIVLRNLDPTWPELPDVLRFDVTRREEDPSRVPAHLADVQRVPEAEAGRRRRKLRFQLADGQWTINGIRYDPARIDFRPKLGTTEIWEIENGEQTQMHPFHQHMVPVQILDLNGEPPPPALAGWKDTVAIPPAGRARLIMRFSGYTGTYVFHCHKLEHEDYAMMLQQEVVA